jgi:4-alpha-glucanotransferase
MADARRRLTREVLKHQYLQWIAETQWREAHAAALGLGVTIFGDVPFMVMEHSADVWVRAREFRFDATVGAPPDPFSATGQDWGMPVYRWDVIAHGGFAWMRARARRMAALYDGFRLDHIIGFYRTYARPSHGDPFFIPADESSQLAQGETLLRIFIETGATVVAEDLGVLPHFLRASLDRLGVPGYRVMRWERAWHEHGHPYLDPRGYPSRTVAATGTHDTEPLAVWWEGLGAGERQPVLGMLAHTGATLEDDHSTRAVIDALLTAVYASASAELFVPIPDLFGWRDRINTPATVTAQNWTWRLPWPVDRMLTVPAAASRAEFLQALARGTGRG